MDVIAAPRLLSSRSAARGVGADRSPTTHVQELIRVAAAARRRRRRRRAHARRRQAARQAADARRRCALTLDDADQAGARSQPRHRGPAAEPADLRLLDREPAARLQADADVDAQPAVGDEPVRRSTISGAAGGTGIDHGTTTLQRRRRAELPLGRRRRWRSTLNNNRQTTTSLTALFNPAVQHQLVGASTRSRCCATSRSTPRGSSCVVTKLNQDISEIQLQALDHQHASRTCATRTGTTCSRCSRWTSRSGRSTSPSSSCKDNQTRVEIGTMAPIDVVQAQSQAATQRQNLATAEGTRRTAELALKRLIVSGTHDPNWSATLDPTDRPDFVPSRSTSRPRCDARSRTAPTCSRRARTWR